MTDRRVKECIIFNPETGISEDGTMHDCVYRPRINQPKKGEKMTREEAIKVLKKKMYEDADKMIFEHLDGSQCMRTINIDLEMKEAIEVLEQPITLAEFLGWEEGVEYEYKTPKFLKVENNRLYAKSKKCSSGWCNFALFTDEIEDLRKAKKVEPKLKAWHVSDKYSWDCLMKELEEQGYKFSIWGEPTQNKYKPYNNCVAEDEEKDLKYRDFEKIKKEDYEIIEYKKEPPKFYAKIKGWELLGSDIYYFYQSIDKSIHLTSEKYAGRLTKEEWAKLGITDENADFERI